MVVPLPCPSDGATFRLALHFARQEDFLFGSYTLVARVEDPIQSVEKHDRIMEAEHHAWLAVDEINFTGLKVDDMTGHVMRRSGIKALAREGCSFSSMQWMAIVRYMAIH